MEVALEGGGVLIVDRPNDLRGAARSEPGGRVRLSWPAAAMQPLDRGAS
jgi:hypothetical protein